MRVVLISSDKYTGRWITCSNIGCFERYRFVRRNFIHMFQSNVNINYLNINHYSHSGLWGEEI